MWDTAKKLLALNLRRQNTLILEWKTTSVKIIVLVHPQGLQIHRREGNKDSMTPLCMGWSKTRSINESSGFGAILEIYTQKFLDAWKGCDSIIFGRCFCPKFLQTIESTIFYM